MLWGLLMNDKDLVPFLIFLMVRFFGTLITLVLIDPAKMRYPECGQYPVIVSADGAIVGCAGP